MDVFAPAWADISVSVEAVDLDFHTNLLDILRHCGRPLIPASKI